MKNLALRLALATSLLVPLSVLASCDATKTATPQPTSTSAFYTALKGANVAAIDYISPAGAVQLGQVVCENLQAKRSVMWIIKNIITLNGPDDGIDLTSEQRYQFAIAVLASATTHLCPDMKEYIVAPHG